MEFFFFKIFSLFSLQLSVPLFFLERTNNTFSQGERERGRKRQRERDEMNDDVTTKKTTKKTKKKKRENV